jgi:hypothetical protein
MKALIAMASFGVFGLCGLAKADGLCVAFAPTAPEPATIGLLVLGAAIFLVRRRAKKRP